MLARDAPGGWSGRGRGSAGAGAGPESFGSSRGGKLEADLRLTVEMAERLFRACAEAEAFKTECAEVGKLADRLLQTLRSTLRFVSFSSSPASSSSTTSAAAGGWGPQLLYDRPIRRITAETAKSLDRALSLVRRCRRRRFGILHRMVNMTSGSTDFRKCQVLLDASIGDLRWLLSVYSAATAGSGGIVLSLPPIASLDPILAWVWSYVAVVQAAAGKGADRADAAAALANLAVDNERNKKIIAEEGGIPPLLSLLRDAGAPMEAATAAAAALFHLADAQERVQLIVAEMGVPIIVQALSDSAAALQARLCSLAARMAAEDPVAQEELGRENCVRPLVTLLAAGDSSASELPLKTACAEAIWRLCAGSISNSRKIAETKGLLCLSNTVETAKGELRLNSLRAIAEIAAVAEDEPELRRSAFKMNSPAGKSAVEQLLRIIQEVNDGELQILAIKSVGCLAKNFQAKETRVIAALVLQLGHWSSDVATEAAAALGKFAGHENFLHEDHSKAVVELGGVPPLMRLVRQSDPPETSCLLLLCHLALHAGESPVLQREKVLQTLISARSSAPALQHRDLFQEAVRHLELSSLMRTPPEKPSLS